jgi:hypothetical protein
MKSLSYPCLHRLAVVVPRSIPVLPLLCASLLAVTAAADNATVDERAVAVVSELSARDLPSIGGTGKLPFGVALAKLVVDPADASALEYIAGGGMGSGDYPFNAQLRIRGLLAFKDAFSPAQWEQAGASAAAVDEWNQQYTENHSVVLWSSAYLYAQAYPQLQWNWEGEVVNSTRMAAAAKQLLIEYARSVYDRGYSDLLSPTYDLFKIAAWLNLYDLAADQDLRQVADAMLLYHSAHLWLASLDGVVLPGNIRSSAIGQGAAQPVAESQWLLWLWSQSSMEITAAEVRAEQPLVVAAMSEWRPPQGMLQSLHELASAAGGIEFRTQAPDFFMGERGYLLRTTYHGGDFSLSSAVTRMRPEAWEVHGYRQTVHDELFGLAWRGAAGVQQISVNHPYWSGASGADNWGIRGSPFIQVGQHRNAAIILMDIPTQDPLAEYAIWGANRAAEMLPLAHLRFPTGGVSYGTYAGNWIGLETAEIRIAVHVLQDGWVRDRRALAAKGYTVIKSAGIEGSRWRSGFVVEVAPLASHPSMEAFMAAVSAGGVAFSEEPFVVTHTTAAGDVLRVAYGGDYSAAEFGRPEVLVNGSALDYASWPHLESPFSSLQQRQLQLHVGESGWLVDWSASIPSIAAIEVWNGWPLVDGWLQSGLPIGRAYPVGDFVYVEALQRYVYLPDPTPAAGMWMYVWR